MWAKDMLQDVLFGWMESWYPDRVDDDQLVHGRWSPSHLKIKLGENEVSQAEEPVYYTARHLLQTLNNLEEWLLDLPLVLVHGKDLTKPNLVNGIIPAPIPVNRITVEGKKPSLLAFAELVEGPSMGEIGQE